METWGLVEGCCFRFLGIILADIFIDFMRLPPCCTEFLTPPFFYFFLFGRCWIFMDCHNSDNWCPCPSKPKSRNVDKTRICILSWGKLLSELVMNKGWWTNQTDCDMSVGSWVKWIRVDGQADLTGGHVWTRLSVYDRFSSPLAFVIWVWVIGFPLPWLLRYELSCSPPPWMFDLVIVYID